MTILFFLLTVALAPVALIHALWGFGVWVPIRDEETLVRAVVGAKGVTRMPGPIPCFLVAGGILAVMIAIWLPDGMIRSAVIWVAALVFLGRGAIAYARLWRRMTPEEPFATYDRRYFGPLCLALGVGLVLTQIGGS